MVLPDGITSTAFPAVRATCQQIGISFDLWQQDLNKAILAKDRYGLYAADTVAMSIPRQVGKTFDIGALVFADSIINPGTTTVWTAHRFKVSRETFNELRSWARSPLLAPHVDYDEITTGAGNEMIPFRNGSRIVFAARERGAIRGFTKVRRLILDEAQILTEAAMSDLAPTMNQAENPQIILMGTPPKESDPAQVFTELRVQALTGDSEGLLFVEFSADPDADLDDWGQLAKANPSFPGRTGKRAIQRLRKLLTDDDYRREVYGIWNTEARRSVFDPSDWAACSRLERPHGLALGYLGLAVTMDLTSATIVGAGALEDEQWVKPLQHGPGTGWVIDRCVQLQNLHRAPVVVDGRGPAAVFIPHLERAGVQVVTATTANYLDACAGLDTAVREQTLRHVESPELDAAVDGAKRRDVGERWAWGRKKSESNIAPLEAATLAVWALEEGGPSVPDYEQRGVLSI